MIEMRWLCNVEEETVVPPVNEIQYGKPFERRTVVRKTLQYRQMIDTTIRAGMWDKEGVARTANMQWSEWRDVPDVIERDMQCP